MKKINVTQTKDYIAQILRDKIFSGSILDGEKLTQTYIAESLGVSRMPVREAFQLLEQEGFLERLPNRHMVVSGISKEGIINNFRVLCAMEKELFLLLIKHKKDMTPLRISLDQYKRVVVKGDKESLVDKEVNFHLQISKILGDKYIEKLHANLLEGYFTYALRNINYDISLSVENLKGILIALESKEKNQISIKLNTYYNSIIQCINKELNHE